MKIFYDVVALRCKCIMDIVDWSVWGYGEKPARIFIWLGLALTIQLVWKIGIFESVGSAVGIVLLGVLVAGFANKARY